MGVDGTTRSVFSRMMLIFGLIVLGWGFVFLQHGSAGKPLPPPLPLISRPACPFEGCTYGPWILKQRTIVYAAPKTAASQVAVLEVGTKVVSLTGEVHTLRYGKIRVLRDNVVTCNQDNYPKKLFLKRGEYVYEFEYLGEGQHKVWHPQGICVLFQGWSLPKAPLSPSEAWGVLEQEGIQEWWVRIKVPQTGVKGWVLNPKAKGMDVFG